MVCHIVYTISGFNNFHFIFLYIADTLEMLIRNFKISYFTLDIQLFRIWSPKHRTAKRKVRKKLRHFDVILVICFSFMSEKVSLCRNFSLVESILTFCVYGY